MDSPKSIPQEVRLAAAAAVATRRQEIIADHLQLSETLHQIKQESVTEVRSAMGDKYDAYEQHRQMIKRKLREIRNESRPTTESLNQASQQRRPLVAESREYI